MAYGVESGVLPVSPYITSGGVMITSGLGVVKAGSSEKPGGWTGLVRRRVGYLCRGGSIVLAQLKKEHDVNRRGTNGRFCAEARVIATSIMAMGW